jgi:hypothetical protein
MMLLLPMWPPVPSRRPAVLPPDAAAAAAADDDDDDIGGGCDDARDSDIEGCVDEPAAKRASESLASVHGSPAAADAEVGVPKALAAPGPRAQSVVPCGARVTSGVECGGCHMESEPAPVAAPIKTDGIVCTLDAGDVNEGSDSLALAPPVVDDAAVAAAGSADDSDDDSDDDGDEDRDENDDAVEAPDAGTEAAV